MTRFPKLLQIILRAFTLEDGMASTVHNVQTNLERHEPSRVVAIKSVLSKAAPAVWSFRSFHALLLIASSIVALLFVVTAFRFLPVTGDNAYPEAAGVVAAQRWANGLPLYQDYRQAPYLITPFPPAWYAVMAAVAKLGISDLDDLTFFGRALSLACIFGIAGLAYRWNRRLGLPAELSLLSVTFYLSVPILMPWAVTARPDFPALFLAFLGLYFAGQRSSVPSVCLAAVVSGLAFLMRHNSVAVPVALVLWLAWNRRWKHVGVFCALWIMVVGLTLELFQSSTRGALLLNLSGATFGNFALTYVRDIAGRVVLREGHGLALALFALGLLGFVQPGRQGVNLTRIYFAMSLGLAIFGSAARGAAVNHYLEPALALSLLLPVGVARLQSSWTHDNPLAPLAMLVILVLLVPAVDMQRSYFTHAKPNDLRAVVPLIENSQVFTDIPYLAARTPTLQLLEAASLHNTERAGLAGWSSREIVDALKEKRFDLVILSDRVALSDDPSALYPRYPHLDTAIREAVMRNYSFCFESATSYIYAPLADASFHGHNCPALLRD